MASLLFVVADAASLTADETALKTLLETAHTVTPISDETAEASAASYDGAVISTGANSATLGTKYGPTWAKPVAILKWQIGNPHSLFDTVGGSSSQTAIDITFPEHLAANGAPLGNLTLYSAANNVGGATALANLGPGVVPIAEDPGGALVVCCFAEEGAEGVSANIFAKRRALLGLTAAGAQALTAAGEAFVLNLVDLVLTAKPAETVYTVGATSRDFATLTAAYARLAATNPRFDKQATSLWLQLRDDADMNDAPTFNGNTDGFTATETYSVRIEPIEADRYVGVPGQGFRFRYTGTLAPGDDLFAIFNVPWTRYGYFEIDGSQSPFTGDTGNASSSGCKGNAVGLEGHDIYVHDVYLSNRNRGFSSLLGDQAKFWNIEVANVRKHTNPSNDCSGIRIEPASSGTVELYNCTVRDSEDMGVELTATASSTITVRNCTSAENAGEDYAITEQGAPAGVVDMDYCTSEDLTAEGVNSSTGVNPATEFVSATANTAAYFLLRSAAVGNGTGQDLGVGHFAAVDITGTTRPVGDWDRAARQGATLLATLAADSAAYAITGTAATLDYQTVVNGDPGSVVITPTDATLTFNPAVGGTIVADSAAYAITGTAATLQLTRRLEAEGSFVTINARPVTFSPAPPAPLPRRRSIMAILRRRRAA